MKAWIALLRGINVGGRNVLAMRELVACLEELGCTDVRTYIQSGNAVFKTSARGARSLGTRIGAALAESHGFEPRVLCLTVDELDAAIAANPFGEAEADPKTLHVNFLAKRPVQPDTSALEALRKENERFGLDGKLFYLHAPDGIARSKLAAGFERTLGVDATGRNWRTVLKLRELVDELC